YLASPFVFTDPGFDVRAGVSWEERGQTWRTLAATFPAEIQTHSREQLFYVGGDGLIRRHDYTSEEFGRWAKSAHYCVAHHDLAGSSYRDNGASSPDAKTAMRGAIPSSSGSTSTQSHAQTGPRSSRSDLSFDTQLWHARLPDRVAGGRAPERAPDRS